MAHLPVRRESALSTLRQSVGRLPLLLRSMRPTWFMETLDSLDAGFVATHGIRGLIWDIDGTLTAYHATTVHPSAARAFEALRHLPGLSHVILSNAPEWRTLELAGMFPDIPVVRGYSLGDRLIGRRLVGTTDEWSPGPIDEATAHHAVPLRKPSAALVDLAVAALGCPREAAVMVGDQHLTDVAGANLGGIRSIKLRNPARSSFPLSIRFTQRLEALLYRMCGAAG